MKQLIAAIDFSPISESVIDRAEELARAFSARLTLIHVAAGDPDFVGYDAGPQVVRDNRADQLRDEHRELWDRAETLRNAGIDAEALLVEGATVDTLVEKARELSADLIILGSHGKGALFSALMGSVSQGVLRKAHCPLLVIPATGESDAPAGEPDE